MSGAPTEPDPAALDHLRQAAKLLDAAVDQLGAAIDAGLPPYLVGPSRYLATEVRVARRRLGNLRKILTGTSEGGA